MSNKHPTGQAPQLAKVNLVFYNGNHKVGFWPSFKQYDKKLSKERIVERMIKNIIGGGKQKTPWTVAVFFDNTAPMIPNPKTGRMSQPILSKILKKDL